MKQKATEDLCNAIKALSKPLLTNYGLNDYTYVRKRSEFKKGWIKFLEDQKPPEGVSYRIIVRSWKTNSNLNRMRYIEICEWLGINVNEDLMILDLKKQKKVIQKLG